MTCDWPWQPFCLSLQEGKFVPSRKESQFIQYSVWEVVPPVLLKRTKKNTHRTKNRRKDTTTKLFFYEWVSCNSDTEGGNHFTEKKEWFIRGGLVVLEGLLYLFATSLDQFSTISNHPLISFEVNPENVVCLPSLVPIIQTAFPNGHRLPITSSTCLLPDKEKIEK